jgi:NitT/TauT family transport system substrate-binding protein
VLAADNVVRIATLPVDPAACAYYGKDLGFFQATGLAPEIQVISSGAAIVAAVVAGSIDIGWASPVSVATAHLRGLPIALAGPGGLYVRGRQTTGVIVAKDSPLRTARDLEGKILAVDTLRTAGELSTKLWMTQNGADASKLSVVELPFPTMPQALAQGRVDAAFSAEPFITEANAQCRFFADAFASIGPRFYVAAWIANPQWAQTHREILTAFNAVVAKAGAWANDHHPESAAILSKYSGIDPAITRTMARVTYGTRLLASDIQPPIDLAVRYGILASPVRADEIMIS